MIRVTTKGDFNKTRDLLDRVRNGHLYHDLDQYGRIGVDILSRATPVRTSLTAHSWGYRVIRDRRKPGIEWYNTNVVNGTPVAILIQYGHGTGTGGYVQGRDYINPVMRPLFDHIANEIWKKVKS